MSEAFSYEFAFIGFLVIFFVAMLYVLKMLFYKDKRRTLHCLHCGKHPSDYHEDDECNHLTSMPEL
jgi:hypothetical protein